MRETQTRTAYISGGRLSTFGLFFAQYEENRSSVSPCPVLKLFSFAPLLRCSLLQHELRQDKGKLSSSTVVLESVMTVNYVADPRAPDSEKQISVKLFLLFAAITLVGAPLLYVGRNEYLKLLYSLFVSKSGNDEHEALLFAQCLEIYSRRTRSKWRTQTRVVHSDSTGVPFFIFSMRTSVSVSNSVNIM
jgi:hypothetical protein